MKGKQHAKKRANAGAEETNEFNLGYFYRTIEEHIEAFAAQEGCPYSLTDVTLRMGERLTSKAVRQQPGSSELVPEVRQDGKAVRLQRSVKSDKTIHVRARTGRTLSASARKAISRAQKKRWAKWNAARAKQHRTFVLTPARLRAARRNAKKARATFLANHRKAA